MSKVCIVFELDPKLISSDVVNFCKVCDIDLQLFVAYSLSHSNSCFIDSSCRKVIDLIRYHPEVSDVILNQVKLVKGV